MIKQKKWVIMDKNRTMIAKGVPRDRHLVLLSDKKDKKRVLTYESKARAEAAFKGPGFCGMGLLGEEYGIENYFNVKLEDYLEAVPVEIVFKEIKDD